MIQVVRMYSCELQQIDVGLNDACRRLLGSRKRRRSARRKRCVWLYLVSACMYTCMCVCMYVC
jgi:hypothetical protein